MDSQLSAQQLAAAARVLKAMAHPIRLGVMQCLSTGQRSVASLHAEFGCSQSMMSQQLAILEGSGLIRSRKDGTAKLCSLRNDDFLKVFSCMQRHLTEVLHVPEDGQ